MNLQVQLEGSQDPVHRPARLRRSAWIALVSMVERPFFRSARGDEGGAGPTGCQAPFDAVDARERDDPAFAAPVTFPPGDPGLGLLGDTMLDHDLAG